MNNHQITYTDRGTGSPFLLLHGGGGPRSVLPFAERLVEAEVRAITPTHPGFSGTSRPETLHTPADLGDLYVTLLADLDVHDVTVVGFSAGGWIASELALRREARVGRVVIVDGVGIEVDGHPITDVSQMAPAEISALSYHDASRAPDYTTMPEALRAEAVANVATLVSYAGSMVDAGLRSRLADVAVPVLVVWGESDGIADPDYGRAYAESFADGRFELVLGAGHMPQIEQPETLAATILAFAREQA